MKKFWIRLAIYLAALLAIAWGNYAVLLHFHPLAYYYTPEGMLLTAAVTAVEILVVWPASWCYLTHVLTPSIIDGMADEAVKAAKESDEACAEAYADYEVKMIRGEHFEL